MKKPSDQILQVLPLAKEQDFEIPMFYWLGKATKPPSKACSIPKILLSIKE